MVEAFTNKVEDKETTIIGKEVICSRIIRCALEHLLIHVTTTTKSCEP
jgi:hypothetical protein